MEFLGSTISPRETLLGLVNTVSRDITPWFVCYSCIKLFRVDKDSTAKLAKRFNAEMPGDWRQHTGTANVQEVLAAANIAYRSVFQGSRSSEHIKKTDKLDKCIKERTIDVEADSLEEARLQLKSRIPRGLQLLSQKIISNGEPIRIEGVAETVEKAFQEASIGLPSSANIIEKKVLIAPESTVVVVGSFREDDAKMSAKYTGEESALGKLHAVVDEKRYLALARKLSGRFVQVRATTLSKTGNKGLFGIGKTPDSYEVQLAQQAVVEIHCRKKAIIRASVGKSLTMEQAMEKVGLNEKPDSKTFFDIAKKELSEARQSKKEHDYAGVCRHARRSIDATIEALAQHSKSYPVKETDITYQLLEGYFKSPIRSLLEEPHPDSVRDRETAQEAIYTANRIYRVAFRNTQTNRNQIKA